MGTAIAVAAAVAAAVLFALSARIPHAAVPGVGTVTAGLHRRLARALLSRRWIPGAGPGLTAMGLHAGALALAPIPVVPPLGAPTLVAVVLTGDRRRGSRAAVAAGMLLVQLAFASGHAGPAVATTTALDPVAAVVISATVLGEGHAVSPAAGATGIGFGLLAVVGVVRPAPRRGGRPVGTSP